MTIALKEINISRVKIHNQIITEYCLDELRKIDKLEVYGHINNNTGPVISFNIDGIHSYDLAQLLAQQKMYHKQLRYPPIIKV